MTHSTDTEPVEQDIEGLMELVETYGEACDVVARTGSGGKTVAQTRDGIRAVIGSMIARAKLQAKLEIAAARQTVAVPQGWTMGQPITEEMHIAAVKVIRRASGLDGTPQRILDAMLAAAPKPPVAETVHTREPENIREGAPYNNPAFEQLARELGVWGTAQAAICAQFWMAAPAAPVPQGWTSITELCAQMCDSRAQSLLADRQLTAATEARKCASVLRNPPDPWREKLDAAAPQPPEAGAT